MERILVTRPALPPLDEFIPYLQDIWDSRWLTNNGKYHQAFEEALAQFLDAPYVSLFSNGTLALVTALQCLRITGEVITSPYSFVATTHALWWNDIKPVFVDIEPDFCNINPERIEAAITPKTTAILPVHVYGNPCNVDAIQQIADTYGLRLIYDAAHAFGVKTSGANITLYGDLSILSFHATKVFNTFEGGAIVSHDEKTKKRIDYLKNFGFAGETTVIAPGINAKMNEFQAALGLLQLHYFDHFIQSRQRIAALYREKLANVQGMTILDKPEGVEENYAYFPVFINKKVYGLSRDAVYEKLKTHNIYGRRYFYPLISQFPTYRSLPSAEPENLPVARQKTEDVICLPIYPDLKEDVVHRICAILRNCQRI